MDVLDPAPKSRVTSESRGHLRARLLRRQTNGRRGAALQTKLQGEDFSVPVHYIDSEGLNVRKLMYETAAPTLATLF